MTTDSPASEEGSAAELLASRERYRAVLLAALDCVVGMDHRGRVVEWNPAAERTFGWTAQEAIGQEMAELIVPVALRTRHREGVLHYLATERPTLLDRRIEITALRRDGSEFPCKLTITRIARPATRCSSATCATSPSAATPRPSCARRAPGSSPPPTTRAGGSSAISTTAPSSSSSGSR